LLKRRDLSFNKKSQEELVVISLFVFKERRKKKEEIAIKSTFEIVVIFS